MTKTTWDKVMSMRSKDTRHRGVANNLTEDEITTIIATIDYFGGSCRQPFFDLSIARYRVFDFLAMAVGGRLDCEMATKVLVYSFLKVNGDIDKWIEDLRVTDYDCDHKWESLTL